MSDASPALTVVVVAAGGGHTVLRTLSHLARQRMAARIEVLVVVSSDAVAAQLPAALTRTLLSVRGVVTHAPIPNVDKAVVHAMPHVSAPIVVFLEDHAYPEPEWADALLRAHAGPWDVVGSAIGNANPTTMLSWTNLLLAYGPVVPPVVSGEADMLPGHNLSFKRSALALFGADLEKWLGRGNGLLPELLQRGARFYLCGDARLAHANPSRLFATVRLRYHAGRLYAHERASAGRWTPLHRLVYVAGGLAIPLVRYRQLSVTLLQAPAFAPLGGRLRAALSIGLACDGIGQLMGYALGPGHSADVLATFEMDRMQHLVDGDRRELSAESVG